METIRIKNRERPVFPYTSSWQRLSCPNLILYLEILLQKLKNSILLYFKVMPSHLKQAEIKLPKLHKNWRAADKREVKRNCSQNLSFGTWFGSVEIFYAFPSGWNLFEGRKGYLNFSDIEHWRIFCRCLPSRMSLLV